MGSTVLSLNLNYKLFKFVATINNLITVHFLKSLNNNKLIALKLFETLHYCQNKPFSK